MTKSYLEKAKYNIDLYKMNDTQKAEYLNIVKSKHVATTELKDQKMDQKSLQKKLREIENKYTKSFKAILNDDQRKILDMQLQKAESVQKIRLDQSQSQ